MCARLRHFIWTLFSKGNSGFLSVKCDGGFAGDMSIPTTEIHISPLYETNYLHRFFKYGFLIFRVKSL